MRRMLLFTVLALTGQSVASSSSPEAVPGNDPNHARGSGVFGVIDSPSSTVVDAKDSRPPLETSQEVKDSPNLAEPVPPAEIVSANLIRLDPDHPTWLDVERRRVVMLGRICLRQGQLEMFACLKGTKEHESIVSVDAEAADIHAALVALGARPGTPAHWVPEFQPASGAQIEVTVFWTDEHGHRRRATGQDWLVHPCYYYWSRPDVGWLDNITGWLTTMSNCMRPMTDPWVFGGSGFWVDSKTGERHYQAEQGDFICVANFPSAMLDLTVESSDKAEHLMFEAFTPRIPAIGTRVTVVLTPKPEVAVPDNQ